MKAGPDIARVAALIGDPARANMLTALMNGKALTASELANEAGVSAATASSHLAKLADGGLVTPRQEGRHRYFALAGGDVAEAIERLFGLAARAGHLRTRTGPTDPALRRARTCYDHLAGELAVALHEALIKRKLITPDSTAVTAKGARFFADFGIDVAALAGRRALMRPCLDWSERRHHLAGALGEAMLARLIALGWLRRDKATRAVHFSPRGLKALAATFGVAEGAVR